MWPSSAAFVAVCSFQGQPFERNHLSSLRWPPLAASAHASASHPRRSRAATASRRAARLPPRDRKCSCTSRTRSGSPTAGARGDPPARRVRTCARPTGSPPTAATEGARGFPRAPPPRTSTRPTRRRCAAPTSPSRGGPPRRPPHRLVEDVARVRRAALEQPHQQIEVAVLRGRLAYARDPPRAARARSHSSVARSPLSAAWSHTHSQNSSPCCLAHFRTPRCPFVAALAQIACVSSASHVGPAFARAQRNTRRCPPRRLRRTSPRPTGSRSRAATEAPRGGRSLRRLRARRRVPRTFGLARPLQRLETPALRRGRERGRVPRAPWRRSHFSAPRRLRAPPRRTRGAS